MTTEEKIAVLESDADGARKWLTEAGALIAISYELRALRLMLREEIREAAWRLGDEPGKHWYEHWYEALASRKAPPA